MKLEETDFSAYEVDHLSVLPLLYQTGYLTIKFYNDKKNYYMLNYPNFEVENAFLNSLLARFSRQEEPTPRNYTINMVDALEKRDFEAFFNNLKIFLSGIPYDLHMKGEKYYQNIFYFIFTLVGLRLGAEVHTNRGRIDAVMEWKNCIFIFELKLDKSAEEALRQIKEKGYTEQYLDEKKEVYLVGLSFSSAERNVRSFIVEKH